MDPEKDICKFPEPVHQDQNMRTKNLQNTPARYRGRRRCVVVFFLLVLGIVGVHQYFSTQLWGKGLKQWQQEDLDLYYVQYPAKYNFTLNHPNKCSHRPFVVVIVPVAPEHVKERNIIRRTWGNDSHVQSGQVIILFLLGLSSNSEEQQNLLQENSEHQDILQSDFVDCYRNLTIKTMVMLEWLRDHCAKAQYFVKVDADMLLNIKAMMKMLQSPGALKTNYITGLVWYNNVVIRDPSNKFFLPPKVYPNSFYPPYPLGMCYIISADLPKKILQISKEIKPIFMEDVYIGLCIERLQIMPTNPPDISQFVVSPPLFYDRCYYANLIAVTTYSSDQMESYWIDINNPNLSC